MTLRAAVLGSPIAHSLSPALHRAAYAQCGIDATYEAIEVGRGELAPFLSGCGDEWMGFSLTMPLKEEALTVANSIDPSAERLRAANTIVCTDGSRTAYNTDVDGVKFALRGRVGQSVCILGAGASARSAIAACIELGTQRVEVVARRPEAASECAAIASEYGAIATTRALSDDIELHDVPVCISTLPPRAADAITVSGRVGTLLDIAYDPWPSVLAIAWQDAGGEVVSGHEMLLGQAVRQVELMTGITPDPEVMRVAMEAAIAERG